MRNKVFVLSLSLIFVLCSSFSVFASTSITVDMAEPSTSDTQGYLVTSDESGDNVNVFFWSISPYVANSELNVGTLANMNIILEDDSVTFTALYSGTARMTITRVYNSTNQFLGHSGQFHNSGQYVYEFDNPIKYYCYSGNIGIFDDNVSSTNNYLTVNWGGDNTFNADFSEVVKLLESIDKSSSNLYDKSVVISNNIASIKSDTSDMADDVDSIASDMSEVLLRLEGISDALFGIETSVTVGFSEVTERLNHLLDYTEETNVRLENIATMIAEVYSAHGKESTDSLDDSSLNELGGYDGNFQQIGDSVDTALGDISLYDSLSGSAFGLIWNWISLIWQANEKVFMLVMFCLSIGVIKLIFNR